MPLSQAGAATITVTAGSSIQAAINAATTGDVIQVLAGTYSETLTINKSLTLRGDPGDLTVAGPAANAPILDGSTLAPSNAIVIPPASGVSGVVIEGFEIKGHKNPGGTGEFGSGIVAWNSVASNVTVRDNWFYALGWNGVLVGSDNGTVQTGWLVQRNKVEKVPYAGIELTNVTNSQVLDNVVTARTLNTTTQIDPGDSGVGIEIATRTQSGHVVAAGTNVLVEGNQVTGQYFERAGINILSRAYLSTSNATLTGVTVRNNTVSGATVSGGLNTVLDDGKGIFVTAETRVTGAVATVTALVIEGNTLSGNYQGIAIQDYQNMAGAPSHSGIIIADNKIINSTSLGVHVRPGTNAAGISVNYNAITGNANFGVNNEGTGTLNAQNNWWGDGGGPDKDTDPVDSILGDLAIGNIDYTGWATHNTVRIGFVNLRAPTGSDPGLTTTFEGRPATLITPTFQENLGVSGVLNPASPPPLDDGALANNFGSGHDPVNTQNDPITVDLRILDAGVSMASVVAVSLRVVWDPKVLSFVDAFNDQPGTVWDSPGVLTATDDLFKEVLTGVSEGRYQADMARLGDPPVKSNTIDIFPANSILRLSFNVVGAAKTALRLLPQSGTEAFIDVRKLVGSRQLNIPVQPADAVIAYVPGDVVRLVDQDSDPATPQIPWIDAGDGEVDFNDLTEWSSAYFTSLLDGANLYRRKFDIGPTFDRTVFSLPMYSGSVVQFEDLVVFAIAFGFTHDDNQESIADAMGPFDYLANGKASPEPVALVLGEPSVTADGLLEYVVGVDGLVADLRAWTLGLDYDHNGLEWVRAEGGALVQSLGDRAFLASKAKDGRLVVDGAVLGMNVAGVAERGELVKLTFRPTGGASALTLARADLRTSKNQPIRAEARYGTVALAPAALLPASYALFQNAPNPVNPETTIQYALPQPSDVKLVIYNVVGQTVRTLVSTAQAAGIHSIVWDGMDEAGRAVASGVYLYKLDAGKTSHVRRMALTR